MEAKAAAPSGSWRILPVRGAARDLMLDKEDFDWASRFEWFADAGDGIIWRDRGHPDPEVFDGEVFDYALAFRIWGKHRWDMELEHIDGNIWDYRRANLRFVQTPLRPVVKAESFLNSPTLCGSAAEAGSVGVVRARQAGLGLGQAFSMAQLGQTRMARGSASRPEYISRPRDREEDVWQGGSSGYVRRAHRRRPLRLQASQSPTGDGAA